MKVTSGELAQNTKETTSLLTKPTQGGIPASAPDKSSKLGPRSLWHFGRTAFKRPAAIASLIVMGLLLVGRQLRLLEPLELTAFDYMMQLRPALPLDDRLLLVEGTEADIQSYGFPLKDALLNQVMAKLEKHQPAVIGLDIYRDIAYPPGHAEFSTRLKNSDRIVPVCKLSDSNNPGTPPPPGVPIERVGFSDFSVDAKSVVRRALLFGDPPKNSRCMSDSSFSFQLARRYLEQKGIQPQLTSQQHLKLGKAHFKPLEPNDGGYQHADSAGYQILLNYRSGGALARSVTLTDVLQDRVDPNWIKNRIVLIGLTAPSLNDLLYTPYSTGQQRFERTPGVVIHGQIASQLLSSALDGQSLFWFWPEWGEVLWIWVWSMAGGIVVRVVRHPGQQAIAEIVALSLLLGSSVFLFLGSGWIPIVAPALGLIFASTGVLAYNAYEAEQEKRKADEERRYIEEKAREQESNLALLQELLRERLNPSLKADSHVSLSESTDMAPDEDDATAIATSKDFEASKNDPPITYRDTSQHLAGRYEVQNVLGAGGFGLTYLAQDTQRPGTPTCVVKHLKPARRDDKFLGVARRLFETEAEILEKLGKHPQIPQLLAYFEEKQEFYLVQEYVEGHPLSDELPVDKKLPETQVFKFLKETLEILVFIHEHKVIHRDIKPSNIMRRESDNQLFLIDFGAVKQIQPQEPTDQENYTVAIGTRGYAPAEQYAGHPTLSSDIYALGMIGIQALTGIPPYQLGHSESGDVIWRHLVTVREEFAVILEKMVRYHFAARYQSAAEVLQDLQRIMS
ncbi:CHASE2 domain-containing serine/threonine-protein kinase [Allocoleopsis franciscana]|uniref:non-specific serine/threonine protein kinase n=1 Tax=Allocoleopsis franciscana PCC 7113 TaxID=1173027 RepID=K9WJC2_9CYAN|nr:CHASE2 domain-containing serine/threonine-protein kinase [Allocoleopsis franciscana]AFZ19879.1 putative transmembrane sensor domain protein [Allocoleopsis franciscana PCC 7113]